MYSDAARVHISSSVYIYIYPAVKRGCARAARSLLSLYPSRTNYKVQQDDYRSYTRRYIHRS